MKEFFILEGAYLTIGVFALLVTLFVCTRPFMPKGTVKKGLFYVGGFIAVAILSHYYFTISRMQSVKEAFENGKEVVCENRIYTKGANSITVRKSEEWKIVNDNFVSPNYTRKFFLARCFVK